MPTLEWKRQREREPALLWTARTGGPLLKVPRDGQIKVQIGVGAGSR